MAEYPSLAERLEAKVDRVGECWEWQGSKDRGYGLIRVQGRTRKAHREAYRIHRGDIPEGKDLDHLCRNKSCINPDHLEPVSHQENVRRERAARPTCPKGHPRSPENLMVKAVDGSSQCRVCHQIYNRSRGEKNGV